MAKQYNAGVQDYRQTYWQPDYVPLDTDLLACFKITPQPGIDREEAAAAVAMQNIERKSVPLQQEQWWQAVYQVHGLFQPKVHQKKKGALCDEVVRESLNVHHIRN